MASGASTLRDALLPAVDIIRGVPAALGMRLHTVQVVSRSWSGARIGLGTKTDTTTGVKIDLGIYQTKVRQVTERDIVASGGLYSSMDLKVGPITPPYAGSAADNDAISVFDPPVGTNTEVFFNIQGPGMPTGGAWFKKVSQDVSRPFRYEFIVRKTAEVP
jgi:hypothetical protein